MSFSRQSAISEQKSASPKVKKYNRPVMPASLFTQAEGSLPVVYIWETANCCFNQLCI